MNDLTIVYVTASETPEHWSRYQIGELVRAAGRYPIISVSRRPLNLGTNLIDDQPKSYWNIYNQMCRAAKLAKTKYIAMAEDDVLYTPEHFKAFRPPMDSVSYDRSRWSLFVWEPEPIYCLRQRISNCSLIAPRDIFIDAIEERQARWPLGAPNPLVGEVGRSKVEHRLHVSVRPCVEWYCRNPIVQLNHLAGTDSGTYGIAPNGRRLVKKHGQITAIEIPYWGRAASLARKYNGPDATD